MVRAVDDDAVRVARRGAAVGGWREAATGGVVTGEEDEADSTDDVGSTGSEATGADSGSGGGFLAAVGLVMVCGGGGAARAILGLVTVSGGGGGALRIPVISWGVLTGGAGAAGSSATGLVRGGGGGRPKTRLSPRTPTPGKGTPIGGLVLMMVMLVVMLLVVVVVGCGAVDSNGRTVSELERLSLLNGAPILKNNHCLSDRRERCKNGFKEEKNGGMG